MSISSRVGRNLAPKVTEFAPQVTASLVHQALDRAIRGVGPLDGAALAAEKQLDEQKGDVDKGIREVIENNVRMSAAQGFLTNIGGLVTMAVMVPTNVSGLALLQCRMIAGIAHLRGYDLEDKRIRNAILLLIEADRQSHFAVALSLCFSAIEALLSRGSGEITTADWRERGATWTYLTTDEPFGTMTERAMRGLVRMVQKTLRRS